MNDRVVMRIELSAAAKTRLLDISKRRGMTQVAVASRLVDWFFTQPDAVQALVLGQFPTELEADFLRMVLKHMEEQQADG